eukprot:PhF_6_TR15900/c0_g1_i1/m.24493
MERYNVRRTVGLLITRRNACSTPYITVRGRMIGVTKNVHLNPSPFPSTQKWYRSRRLHVRSLRTVQPVRTCIIPGTTRVIRQWYRHGCTRQITPFWCSPQQKRMYSRFAVFHGQIVKQYIQHPNVWAIQKNVYGRMVRVPVLGSSIFRLRYCKNLNYHLNQAISR